jgi:hypothetical protein
MINSGTTGNRSPRRWLAPAGGLALLVALGFQWHTISQLRRENNSLRAAAQSIPPAVATQPESSPTTETVDPQQARKDRLELLRLRNEVRQLREQAARPSPDTPLAGPPPAAPVTPAAASPADSDARQLALAAMHGDSTALDKLAKLATSIRTMNPDEQAAARSDLRDAFRSLGAEAGKGDAAGLKALWQASRIRELQGFAVDALGQAAGLGNEEALKPLLDPEAYLILRSSATSALKPAADAGNAQAIQALAATAADPKQQALWLLAAHGLETAAASGNDVAIDGLASIAAAQNQTISREAVLALEAAARKNQPRAEEALRKLGWR